MGRRERVAARKPFETKPATELGDANQGAFVDRSSILRASTKRGSVELFFIKNEFALVYRFGDAL